MKIKTRLLSFSLALAIGPALLVSLLVGYNTYQASYAAVEAQIQNQLSANTQTQRQQIQRYFATIGEQVRTLAASTMTQDAMRAFQSRFADTAADEQAELADTEQALVRFYDQTVKTQLLERDPGAQFSSRRLVDQLSNSAKRLQFDYVLHKGEPSANASYAEAHRLYHPAFEKFLNAFGYYDIFLVDDQSGDIVYSVFKEIDFATSLRDGPFASTGLGDVFKKSLKLKSDQVALVDFAPYQPSYGYPASFIATPIVRQGQRLGTLVFQMPVERINQLVNVNQQWRDFGLGETGASYLVAADQTLRNDYRPFVENKDQFLGQLPGDDSADRQRQAIQQQNTTIGLLAAPSASASKALGGETGLHYTEDYQQQRLVSAYAPLDIEGLSWAIVSEMHQEEAFAPIYALRQQLIWQTLWVTALCAAVATLIGVTLANRFVRPIHGLLDAINRVERDSDFSHRVPVSSQDEIGQAAIAVNRLLDEIQSAIAQVDEVVRSLSAGDFSKRIDSPMRGDLQHLKQAVNMSVDAAQSSMLCIDQCMTDLSQGHFQSRHTPQLQGDYQRIVNNSHQAMQAMSSAIERILQVIHALSQGDFEQRVELELPGQLGELKERLNHSLDTLNQAADDIEKASSAQSQGDLSVRITAEYEGTFARLKNNSNLISERLIGVLQGIRQSARTVHTAAEEISQGNTHLSQRTETQAADLEHTSQTMAEITQMVLHSAQQADSASHLSVQAREAAESGGRVAADATQAMSEIKTSSRAMSDITATIDEIAFQTNLLALNASVEAARAGQHGAGFAVVADEVRNLAVRCTEATSQIKRLIQSNLGKIQQGSQLVNNSGDKLSEIVDVVQSVSHIVADMAQASQEQSVRIEHIHQSMKSVDENTQQNASMVQQVATASESLSQQSQQLTEQLGYFKLACA